MSRMRIGFLKRQSARCALPTIPSHLFECAQIKKKLFSETIMFASMRTASLTTAKKFAARRMASTSSMEQYNAVSVGRNQPAYLNHRSFTHIQDRLDFFLQLNKSANGGFKKTWLSDPATYPIIAVMTCALSFMTVMSAKCLITCKDVKISPENRKTMMR